MTPAERYAAEMSLLEAALDAPVGQRERVIRDGCGGDETLKERVMALLREHQEEAPIWDTAPALILAQVEPGDVLCERFEVQRLLGEGGMGQVWAARDRQSGEDIAVKVIRPELTLDAAIGMRFKRELQIARKVAHPNVCRVNEIFEDTSAPAPRLLFTMELLSGESLRDRIHREGPIPAKVAAPWIRQIVEGLAAAHRAGVIHRDLKPGNIMLVPATGGERAVIMDFGLARMAGSTAMPSGQTSIITLIGTPDYMAPEQVAGAEVTPATDIYALGLTMFEMLTGTVALKGRTSGETNLLRARRRPPRLRTLAPTASAATENLIQRCLEFEPAARFADATAVIEAIDGEPRRTWMRRALWAGGAAASIYIGQRGLSRPGVAALPQKVGVLPFESIGNGAEEQYLADGLTEQVLTGLQAAGLELPGRGSTFYYQKRALPLSQIARELGVQWLITGTIRMQGERAAVFAQLVDATGRPGPWSQSYERDRKQIGSLGSEISHDAAGVLAPGSKSGPSAMSTNPEANDLFLRGRFHWTRRNPEDQRKALALFRQAVATDPGFAPARCCTAEVLAGMADLHYLPAAEALPEARREAIEAIRLDPSLGHAYAILAHVSVLWQQDGAAGTRNFERAISLDPNDILAYVWFSHLLLKVGRAEECLRMATEAHRRDPLNLQVHFGLGSMAYFTRRYDQAYRTLHEVSAKAPDYYLSHELLSEVCARLGKRAEAIAAAEAALRVSPHRGHAMTFAANAFAILGETERARELLAEVVRPGRVASYEAVHVARGYAELGLAQESVAWLETARTRKETGLQTVRVHHSYDRIRNDSRYKAFERHLPFAPVSQ